jgi:hypothetical protein
MGESRTTVRRPVLPPLEFLSSPEYSIRSDCGRVLISYDPITRTGFVYRLAEQVWTIVTPIDFNAFDQLVRQGGYSVTDSADARRWRAACDPGAPNNVIPLPDKTRH